MGLGEGWDPPAEVLPWSDFHWWKVVAGKVIELIVLSEMPLWYTGHFTGGRMKPCYGTDCAECKKGTGGQIRYVLSCAEVSSARVGIIEVGRTVGLQIKEMASSAGTSRGLWLEFGKETTAKQSRMTIKQILEPTGDWWHELPVPDMREALAATWDKAKIELPEGFQRARRSMPPSGGYRK
jgi:hypothetical protein